jgi:predicted nucleic acid-binding protein
VTATGQRIGTCRRRQVDLAIAACAIEARASLWTLNRSNFRDLPGLMLYEKH